MRLVAFSLWTGLHFAQSTPLRGLTFVFYYLWYGNPESNGKFEHWDHEVLPHWTAQENKRYPSVGSRHSPPEILHAPFYPARGPYSSTNQYILDEHFEEIREMGARGGVSSHEVVVALSWWGQASRAGTADTQGVQTDTRIAGALMAAERANITVAWHLEPYPGRSARSVADDVLYIERTYGSSRAIKRLESGDAVYFVYDSYHISAEDWAGMLRSRTPGQGFFIGLWLEREHGQELAAGGFDGFYTYFASAGFVFGSTPRHWLRMCDDAHHLGIASVLTAGPGYDDEVTPS
jgi:glycoprotein endo-alpha-1,2-mannosidase